jgi:hypothetical protein
LQVTGLFTRERQKRVEAFKLRVFNLKAEDENVNFFKFFFPTRRLKLKPAALSTDNF